MPPLRWHTPWTVGALLLLTATASAQPWQITIKGNGPRPTVEITSTEVPPVVVPPVVLPPPIVPPVLDDSPFVWPPQPPPSWTDDPSMRYTFLGNDPATGWPFYTGLSHYPNPQPGSHLYAGITPEGRRLWVPARALPSAIRRALATGRL